MNYNKSLIPIFENGRITNLPFILNAIAENDNIEELLELGRESLFPIIQNKIAREDLEIIQRAIDLRLEKLEEEQAYLGISNENTLNELKKQNTNLNALSIVETKKETNDSKRNTDYIKFVDNDGSVQMLECAQGNTLNKFILNNQELVANGGAKEIFDYLRKYVHNTLKFENFSDNMVNDTMEQIKQNGVTDTLVNDEKAVAEEKDLINEFVIKQKISIIPRVSVNTHGERIYNVGEIIIKFRDNYGKRKMEIISGEHLVKDQLENVQGVKTVSAKDMTTNEKHSMKDSYKKSLIDEATFTNLLNKLNNQERLTPEEKAGMKSFIASLISGIPNLDSNINFEGLIDAYEIYLDIHNIPLLTSEEFSNLSNLDRITLIGSKLSAEREIDEMNNTILIEPTDMQKITNILSQLYMAEAVDESDLTSLQLFMNNAINAMENGTITPNQENLLGMYLEYLKEIKAAPLIESELAIINKHNSIELAKSNPKTLKLTLPVNDTSGIITSVAIIEVVTLLGFLIAVLALVRV